MTVKYADGELERLETLGKVYVNGLNKEASWKEVEDIFSPYGLVLDVYILRDELRQSRGADYAWLKNRKMSWVLFDITISEAILIWCGFVKFSQIDMALAAIKALNGTFIMRGCAQPLLVRFADPKKPKGIDSRGNFGFSSGNIGPHSQEPFRLVSDHGDPMGGHNFHSAPYPVQQTSNPPIPQLANPEPLASIVMPPPQLCRMPLQQTQNTQRSSQTSQVEANETQKQHLTQPSGQIIGQQQSSQTVASNSTSPALASSHETAVPLECDWSEHTCPDGYKYYYNCETCESIWDKPEEFALFEKQLQTQTETQPQNSSHHLQSTSVLSIQQSDQAQELDHLQIQPQTSPLVGPT
nr:flowering time control protein FCA isoform X3 [Malus domestica]XP_028964512.1 flowering time control protein FCA isoform X3 [Malus domestica]